MGWESALVKDAKVVLCTGDLRQEYTVVDVIDAVGSPTIAEVIDDAVPAVDPLSSAKNELVRKAAFLHADAVIWIRLTVDTKGRVYAYGTAVRFAREVKAATKTNPVHVGKALIDAGLPQYIKLFSDNEVTPERMATMTEPDLGAMGSRFPSIESASSQPSRGSPADKLRQGNLMWRRR